MSPFKQEIVKILLDKLLLGAIAAGFGFYLSRLLEDYRTRNAYQLIVAKERIDSYRKFIEFITEHHLHVVGLLDVLQKVKQKYPLRLSDDDAAPGYAYIKHYEDFQSRIYSLVAFFSYDLMNTLHGYMDETLKVSDYVKNADLSKELPDKTKIDEAFIKLLHACSIAMSTG
jgi:hypothetical protein